MSINISWFLDSQKKNNVNKLVYFEETNDVSIALAREKEIKKWNRKKRINSY